jgi:2-dehydropantoate 2-reductase
MTDDSNLNRMRVAVVGMGPVGSVLAAALAEAGAFVVACDVDRPKIDKIKSDGIRLEQIIEKEVKIADACYSVEDLGKFDLDLIAVAVKTPSLKPVVSLLAKSLSEKVFVMCAQNGLGNEQVVAELVGENRTLRMSINYAGGMINPNTVQVIFFNPPNYVAALTPDGESLVEKLAQLLNSVELATEIPDNIEMHVWKKAILNAALSPVCAITGKTMKAVMDSPDGQQTVREILDESIRVAYAEGIIFGDDFLDFCLSYLKKGGDHKPSMLVDLENGLPTEIDYLNGRIAEYGKKHNIRSPYNQAITAFVHMLEKSTE